jgi:hypothetical protein
MLFLEKLGWIKMNRVMATPKEKSKFHKIENTQICVFFLLNLMKIKTVKKIYLY